MKRVRIIRKIEGDFVPFAYISEIVAEKTQESRNKLFDTIIIRSEVQRNL